MNPLFNTTNLRNTQKDFSISMDELIEACQKFKDGSYSIEDLYRRLSWVAVPNQIIEIVSAAERELELIRFTELEEVWHDKGIRVIDDLLKEIGYR